MVIIMAKIMHADNNDDASDMTVQWVNLPPEMTAERGSSPPLMQLQTSWSIRIYVIEIIMVDSIMVDIIFLALTMI